MKKPSLYELQHCMISACFEHNEQLLEQLRLGKITHDHFVKAAFPPDFYAVLKRGVRKAYDEENALEGVDQ